jgi:hypothetical protein
MNLLQLCNRLILEAGMSTGTSVLTTTANQTGELARVVNWVQAAWMDIQAMHQDWQWMRKSTSFVTVSGQALYEPVADIGITDLGQWTLDTARNYPTTVGNAGEIFMSYIDYEMYRDSYLYGALRYATSRPTVFTITPDKSIGLGIIPTSDYTVTLDYFSRPTEMADDTAEPELPDQFHLAIVWRALMFYGSFEAATESFQRGRNEFTVMIDRLEIDRLPKIQMGGPLA